MVSIKDLSLDDKECDIPINDLPDDILIRILSLLTLKEAGRTSVLSTRWRHVWAYVPSLKFDPSSIIQAWLRQTKQDRRDVDFKYVRWVDQVLSSHKAHSIEEFYVSCLLDENRKDTIDNWLRFAMEKSVKRLGLSVLPHGYRGQAVYFYKFPSSSSWNQLTSLSLAYVEVSGEFFENFLCDCQTLKSLSVFSSGSLVDSKIVGPLSLKSLEILHCSNLKDLEISAPNLLYFQYSGPQLLSWPLTNTPKIVEVVIQGKYANYFVSDSSHLPNLISQIEVLSIMTQFRVQPCTTNDLLKDNRINDLPDDILIHMLSLLTLKEAGRTSVLSNRWRHVWAYVPSLNFDDYRMREWWIRKTRQERKDLDLKYVRWVDQVVSSHKAHDIDEFNVNCLLDENRKDTIDNWLRFAMEKRVKRLGLGVLPNRNRAAEPVYCYKFPSLSSWNQLTSLKLTYVEVSGEFLENFLRDCQSLDSLSVFSSDSLVHLKIVVPLNLKSLEIIHCFKLKHLEISAPNLIYFHYFGPQLLSWPLKSTSKTVEVVILGKYANYLISDSSHLPSRMSQIEELTIKTQLRIQGIAEVFPVFPRLKMLRIHITPVSVEPLFGLSSLILACPVLHKLVLRLNLTVETITMAASRRSINAKSFSHNHLKILEISGFSGSEQEVQLVEYLIESAVSLEKLIIKADVYKGPGVEFFIEGREAAKLLFGNLKPGIEMEVRDEFDKHLWTARKA